MLNSVPRPQEKPISTSIGYGRNNHARSQSHSLRFLHEDDLTMVKTDHQLQNSQIEEDERDFNFRSSSRVSFVTDPEVGNQGEKSNRFLEFTINP